MNLIATIADRGVVSSGAFTVELIEGVADGDLLTSWSLSGLWVVKGVTRIHFGRTGDIPGTR